jgi:CBS domain containing-hemolysin-like protein
MNTMFIVGLRPKGRRRPGLADLRGALRLIFAAAATSAAGTAWASIFEGETLDAVANVVSWVVLVFVPIVVIVVFWLIHVLPEKIAHKRHHPQRDAIQTLCLLSLVFGGLLWPIAWLWAYTKPVGYKMAYGTEKHEEYYDEMHEKLRSGELVREEARHLREELEAMEARGALPPKLRGLKDELARLRLVDAQERAPKAAEVGT